MKKIPYLIFLSALFAISAQAKRVSEAEARRIADLFMEIDHTTRTGSQDLEMVWNGLDFISTKADANTSAKTPAPFYVFNRQNGGFVIVAGDDRERPILAYSQKNSFSHTAMPDNIKAWTERMISHMENVMKGNTSVSENTAQWQQIESMTKALGGNQTVLETAQWNQSQPFNNYCSQICGTSVVTGCSAIAAAILMRYHKYPSQAYGPIPGYITGSYGFAIPQNNPQAYDWDKMPLSNAESWTDAQKAQVSKLIYDCGTAFQANYGPSSTSATDLNLLHGMTDYMKFSKNATRIIRSDFSLEEWLEILKNEIDRDTPIIYTGQTVNGFGHAFIIDGYDSNGYLHVNWGWGGQGNGFYAMTEIEYSLYDNALIGLVPDNNWTNDPTTTLSIYNDISSFTTDTPYIRNNADFKVACSIWNSGNSSYTGTLHLKLFSADGTAKETLKTFNINNLAPTYITTLSSDGIRISGNIEDGDYLAWTYTTRYGEVTIHNNRFCHKPLRYNLAHIIGLSYNRLNRQITIDGLSGMTCTFQGSDYSFPFNNNSKSNSLVITANSQSGTYPLTISNGNETITVDLTF